MSVWECVCACACTCSCAYMCVCFFMCVCASVRMLLWCPCVYVCACTCVCVLMAKIIIKQIQLIYYFLVLPLQATSNSRRIGYLTFIVCAYLVHSFYTSNLLSHLVSDREKSMDLNALVESDYQFALLKDMNIDTDRKVSLPFSYLAKLFHLIFK